jgi:adenosylmethionine-8-amino-7-oxononanoate aminotransferase
MTDDAFWSQIDRHLIRTPILDFTSGQMSAVLGHGHPDIVAAATRR